MDWGVSSISFGTPSTDVFMCAFSWCTILLTLRDPQLGSILYIYIYIYILSCRDIRSTDGTVPKMCLIDTSISSHAPGVHDDILELLYA